MNALRIALIGFAHAGKTSVGHVLSQHWQWPLIDSDHAISESTGMTPAQWLKTQGEDAFRQSEHHWLKHVSFLAPCILATGGGLPCFHGNLALLHKLGFYSVFLDPEWSQLEARLFAPPGHALTQLYSSAELKAIWIKRSMIYRQAHLHIRNKETPEDWARAIIEQLERLETH